MAQFMTDGVRQLTRIMGRAAVFFRRRDVVVHSQHRTTDGVWIAGAPVSRVHRDELAIALVEAVRDAISKSRDGIAHPTDWKRVIAPVLDVAHVRSWAALARGSRLCEVEDSIHGMTVVPTRNGGATGDDRGFRALRNLEIR